MAGLVTREGEIVRHGDKLALVLDPEVVEQMRIGPATKLDIVTDGDSLIVTVRDEVRRAKLSSVIKEMHEQYGEVFKRLAE